MVSLWSGGSLWYSVLSSRDCRVNECIEKVYFLPTSNSLQYLIKHYCCEALMVLHLKMYKKTNTLTSWTSSNLVWNTLTQIFYVHNDNKFIFLQQTWSLQTALIILEFSPLGLWCRWCPGWERRERLLGVISLQCAPLVWCWHWCEIRTCHGASSSQQLRTVETDNCYDDDHWESVRRSQHLHGFLYNLITGLFWV